MQLNKRLNFVIPVERPDGSTLYVHATPISAETFDQFYMELAQTHTKIFGGGLGSLAGPRVAAKLLRDVAKKNGTWEGEGGVETTLMNEVRRLCNVIVPKDGGWMTISMQEAITKQMFDAEDRDTLENAIVFFIVISAVLKREESRAVMEVAAGLWSAQTTLLNCTAFAGSLPTQTVTVNTGASEKVKQLSVPR